MWKIYGKSIHLLSVQWIGRIGLYGFCSNLDCNGLIRNYRIFGGVGWVALLYYVVALENFRTMKEIDTQQDIYVLKAVLNLWENCTDQNCFLFKGLIFYVLLGSKYRISQQTLSKLHVFFPSKITVGPCQCMVKKLKEKGHNAKTITTVFVWLIKTQLYSTISLIIHEKTQYMPVTAILTFNFHNSF